MSRILVVDDDVDISELIKTKLNAEGHQAFVINTGEGAFEYAKQVKPDICVLDIMLPGVTGYQICRRFRKDPELYRMAVLILTALGEEPEILHGLEQGADDYLVKPFKLERLMDKIASLNALLGAIDTRNRVTNLPGTDAIKREINHQLARGNAIATIYVDMVGFKPLCAARGPDGQRQALEFMSKLLVSLTRDMGIYECFVAHMGGEHFVVLLKLEDHERFTSSLIQTFDQRVRELYTRQERDQGYIIAKDRQGKDVRCPFMALSIGVAHTQYRQFKSAKKMFEVLAQVRQKAQPTSGKSVVFVDRRRTDR
ncbi:MAG TPA: response regulator [Candidatus Hydrogenedentes bacterium]|nr:response regulator [Candidatus Hydrogenedentota bacterium]